MHNMASVLSCDRNRSVGDFRLEIRRLLAVLDIYRWIIEAYVSDFFVKDHWEKLPTSWQHYLDGLSFAQLACLLTGEPLCSTADAGSVAPLSLLALKRFTHTHSLKRQCVDLDSACLLAAMKDALHVYPSSDSFSGDGSRKELPSTSEKPGAFSSAPRFKNGQLLEMEHIFRKHVKPKKQHEIQRLAKVISWLSEQTGSSHVVDVGAGLGHLSRLLTFAHRLKVTTVEATDGHAPKASEFDRELEKDILKKLRKIQGDEQNTSSSPGQTTLPSTDMLPSHVVCTVRPDITTEEFLRLVLHTQSPAYPESTLDSVSHMAASMYAGDGGPVVESLSEQQGESTFLSENKESHHDAVAVCGKTEQTVIREEPTAAKVLRRSDGLNSDSTSRDDQTGGALSSCVIENAQSQNTCLDAAHVRTSMDRDTDSPGNVDTGDSGMSRDNILPMKKDTAEQDRGEGSHSDQDSRLQTISGLVLAGLHACGDLTATLLRVFVNCPAVLGLVSVGCCYMKLSCYSGSGDHAKERGYPMSKFTTSLRAHSLTYEAREMACHFADAYAKRLLEGPSHLKIHGYRAAFQYVVTRVRPDFQAGSVRLVLKKGADVPFAEYARQCFHKLGIDTAQVPAEVMTSGESLAAQWRRVVAFYTLRLSLAPLVETLILLDRMLFLAEHGMNSLLLPVFDSSLSPRNFALISCRHKETDSVGHHKTDGRHEETYS